MSFGTPMLCNLTSDLADHISDGVNGLIIPAVDAHSFIETIKRAWALSLECYLELRQHAKEASQSFHYSEGEEPLSRFILSTSV